MRFGCKIDQGIELVLGHKHIHLVGIVNVSLEELVAIAVRLSQTVEVGKVAGVGQDINIRDVSRLVMFQNVANKVAANETAAARH